MLAGVGVIINELKYINKSGIAEYAKKAPWVRGMITCTRGDCRSYTWRYGNGYTW